MFDEWYLVRDKGSEREICVIAYPTQFTAVRKFQGCVEYKATQRIKTAYRSFDSGFYLLPENCTKIFDHCPKKGELLCVKKTRKGWKAEKIDLEFSN